MDDIKNEEEKEYLTIIDENGNEKKMEVVLNFRYKDNGQEYVIYTENETDAKGNVTVYTSRVVRNNPEDPEDFTIETITDDAEWEKIKDTLKDIAKSDKNEGEE